MNSEPRRFPLPWSLQGNESCYWVEDADGKRFGFTYFDTGTTIGSGRASYLSRDEARRIARAIAKLPDLLSADRGKS